MLEFLDQCFAQTCDVAMDQSGSVKSSLCPCLGLEGKMLTGSKKPKLQNNNLMSHLAMPELTTCMHDRCSACSDRNLQIVFA